MSILLLVAPVHPQGTEAVADDALMGLWDRAQAQGEDLVWRACADIEQVTDCLAGREAASVDLVLLDVDADAIPEGQVAPLRRALNELSVPLIEIHADSRAGDLATISPAHPSLVSVTTPGNPAAGYEMALSIGLRYLARNRQMAA
ncbi:hypothetical protein [Luteibacter yeojuensis]